MTDSRRRAAYRRGHAAEYLAAAWLLLKGYRLLARRWKSPYGEIDLIARRGKTLTFVEVKTRKTMGEALEAVTPHQRRRIAQAASAYLQQIRDASVFSCRFDVVAYVPPLRLRHVKDAWREQPPCHHPHLST